MPRFISSSVKKREQISSLLSDFEQIHFH